MFSDRLVVPSLFCEGFYLPGDQIRECIPFFDLNKPSALLDSGASRVLRGRGVRLRENSSPPVVGSE